MKIFVKIDRDAFAHVRLEVEEGNFYLESDLGGWCSDGIGNVREKLAEMAASLQKNAADAAAFVEQLRTLVGAENVVVQ